MMYAGAHPGPGKGSCQRQQHRCQAGQLPGHRDGERERRRRMPRRERPGWQDQLETVFRRWRPDAGFSSRLVAAEVTATAASPRVAPCLARCPPAASPVLIAIQSGEWSAARLSTTKNLSARCRRASAPPLPGLSWAAAARPNTARMHSWSAREPAGARDVGTTALSGRQYGPNASYAHPGAAATAANPPGPVAGLLQRPGQ